MAPTAPRPVKITTEFGSLEAFVASDGCSATFKVTVSDAAVRASVRRNKAYWLADFDRAIAEVIAWPFRQVSIKEVYTPAHCHLVYYIRVERVAPVEPEEPGRKRKIIFG